MVVEDNEDVREVVVKQLADLGYRVVEADNAVAALKLLGAPEQAIDLMFSDVVMPGGMSGIDLSREARKLRPDLRVILTSGFAEVVPHTGERPGEALSFLGKPYRKHELARRIRETLTR
jgi:CheY-like chemotaxis protein